MVDRKKEARNVAATIISGRFLFVVRCLVLKIGNKIFQQSNEAREYSWFGG
jgi:hypothetical protein